MDGARAWHDDRKQKREALRSKTLDDARRRKTEAEAELAEIELGTARGELIRVTDVEEQVNAVLDRLRSQLLAVPGKWGPMMVGKRTPAEAMVGLETIIGEVMEGLSG